MIECEFQKVETFIDMTDLCSKIRIQVENALKVYYFVGIEWVCNIKELNEIERNGVK